MQLQKGSEYSGILISEYDWLTFHRILSKSLLLNIPGHRIWQGCKYARVTKGAEYA